MTQKGNQNLVAYRRELVARLALRGLSVRAIAKQLASMGAPIENPRTRAPFSKSVIASDIVHMRREWREHAGQDIDEHQARLLAKLEEVERQAWKKSDYALVLKIIDRIAKLLGVDAPTRSEFSGPSGGPIELPMITEERAEEVLRYYSGAGLKEQRYCDLEFAKEPETETGALSAP